MKPADRRILLCNCERTMALDSRGICRALDRPDLPVHSHLCRAEVGQLAAALGGDEPILVACTQEAPLFRELAAEAGKAERIAFANIRERAGWTKAREDPSPKVAALLAEALIEVAPANSIALKSDGTCLVYGAGQAALDAARKLHGRLSVTLLLTEASEVVPPAVVEVPIYSGTIAAARGHFGAFEITVNRYAPALPSSKNRLEFALPRDGAKSRCSLILDLSGGAPLFPAHARREGYFHVDPRNPLAIAEAMFALSDLVGEFDKPLYVRYDPEICAHSRNRKIGCRRCLDVCPAAAIASTGDTIVIDPALCGGCGACASVCPTGAASYLMPARQDLVRRVQVLLATYLGAGGSDPVLLVHDAGHGAALIDAMARFGRGLPVQVLPFAVNEVTQIGHEFCAAALACGASQIVLLANPRRQAELAGLEAEAALINAIMAGLGHAGGPRVGVVLESDPDRVEAALWDRQKLRALKAHAFQASSAKRELARTAFALLNDAAPEPQTRMALPLGAPYGRIRIRTEGCTLCLACVSACPVAALADNPERPQVRFIEQACVQCGLCRATCPENVISLEPGYDFTPAAMTPEVLHEEEPYACIRCGKPFGTRSSVERIAARLGGKHRMFQDAESQKLIRMCDNCRIAHLSEIGGDPLAGGARPRIRTTEDYLAEEERVRAGGERTALTAGDFLIDKR